MSLSSMWRFLFPPPRYTVTWRSALPLMIFLIVFAALCSVLVWTRRFAFMNYWGFSALLSAPWVWWMYLSGLGGLQRLRGLLALLLRLTMVGLFAIALSDPRSVRESDKLSVVYALDVSDSIGTESIDQALDFVLGTTEKKSAKDEAGLVVFARGAAH
ncbi:MAG: hypothetical protein O3C60_16585 [Planctomycetota bacterium]|nr:hypothetical protein [Planctomycetota bacterium]